MRAFQAIRSFRSAAVLATVLSCAACGGGSSSPSGGGGTTGTGTGGGTAGKAGTGGAGAISGTPVQLCGKLVQTICMRLKSCNVLQNPAAFVEADCERVENVEFGCDRATSTAFPDCLADVQAVSCAGLFSATAGLQLPPSCDDPVNTIPLSTAQQKCADLAGADCARLAQCLGITPTADQLQQCQIDDYANAGCGLATDVGPTYAQCLNDLGTAPCPSDAGTSPDAGVPSCDNAIVFVQ
jgi:hypothetical protein